MFKLCMEASSTLKWFLEIDMKRIPQHGKAKELGRQHVGSMSKAIRSLKRIPC